MVPCLPWGSHWDLSPTGLRSLPGTSASSCLHATAVWGWGALSTSQRQAGKSRLSLHKTGCPKWRLPGRSPHHPLCAKAQAVPGLHLPWVLSVWLPGSPGHARGPGTADRMTPENREMPSVRMCLVRNSFSLMVTWLDRSTRPHQCGHDG